MKTTFWPNNIISVAVVAFNFEKLISHFIFTMLQFCEMDGISNKQVNRHYETCSSQRVSDLLLVSYLWCHIWDMSPGLHVWAVFSSKMYFEWTAPLCELSLRSCRWSLQKLIEIANGICYHFSSVCHMSCSTSSSQETGATSATVSCQSFDKHFPREMNMLNSKYSVQICWVYLRSQIQKVIWKEQVKLYFPLLEALKMSSLIITLKIL